MVYYALQVERDLDRSKKELKKELEHARAVSDQDRAHRERFDLCKQKLKDMVETSETLHGMASDLEESTAHMKVKFMQIRVMTMEVLLHCWCFEYR